MTARRLTGLLLALAVVALATLFSSGLVLAQTPTVDYDVDNDNLIEIANLDQLNAIRWDLDGDGAASTGNEASYAAAFPGAASGMGCATTCLGYELTTNLDFDTNRNGVTDGGDAYWNDGAGWDPIRVWTATFDGGYHTISNLFINRSGNEGGLFGRTDGSDAVIRNVGLPNVNITVAGDRVGALVGFVEGGGLIEKSFATGKVTTVPRNVHRYYAGGLVGDLTGTVQASWTDVDVRSGGRIGGLVGLMDNNANAAIIASYSLGDVISRGLGSDLYPKGRHLEVGGLYGAVNNNVVSNSYFDNRIVVLFHYSQFDGPHSARTVGYGATARSTAQMQNSVGYTGIYAAWNLDLDGDGTGDDPWDFGTASQYPALKGDSDNDGVFTWQEFGDQGRVDHPDVIVTSAQAAVTEGQTVRFTVTIDTAPAQALPIDVRVQAKGDYGVADAATTVTIPAGRKSVAYTVNTVSDTTDERAGWVQLSALTGEGYDLPVPSSRVNVNDDDLPASAAGVYAPRLPQASGSLDGAATRTSQRVPRPGTFSLHVRPDNSSKARQDAREFGETQEYQDYHASLKYKWEQISGPPLGPPLKGGCEKNLPGHSWGHSTYCTYSLYSPEQVMSWNVWDGVTRPSALYEYRINGANPPGDYVFRLIVRDQYRDDSYTAPQTVTVTVADETGGASAPRAVGTVTTRSLHPPQSSYTVIEAGKGPDGVYGTNDDTGERGDLGPDGVRRGNEPGPDGVWETSDDYISDDNVLVVGDDGLPCTDDDTLACGPDNKPGTDDDELNLGPDNRIGTDDDNTYVVDPPGNALQSPDKRVTLSGSSSRAARGRSIRSYAWQQICMNPDAEGDHKLIAYHILLRGLGYCGVDVELSRASGSTTTFTTPSLPAEVRRVSADIRTLGTVTTTTEDSVNLFFMLTVTDSEGNRDYDILRVDVEPLAGEIQIPPQAHIKQGRSVKWVGERMVECSERDLEAFPPICSWESNPPALENTRVTLDGSGSNDDLDDGRIVSYEWTQIAGTGGTLSNADSSRATFLTPTGLTADTMFRFRLTVTDNDDETDTAEVGVLVRVERPTAAAGESQIVNEGDSVTLTGSGAEFGVDTLFYSWRYRSTTPGAPALSGLPALNTQEIAFTAPSGLTRDSTYQFTLTVSGGGKSATDNVEVKVAATAKRPTADAGPDQTTGWGRRVKLNGVGSTNPYRSGDGEGDSYRLQYSWRQTSGTPTVEPENPTSSLPHVLLPPWPGIVSEAVQLRYTLTVTDMMGVTASDSVTITVSAPTNAGLTANAGSDRSLKWGDLVTLSGSGDSGSSAPLQYGWRLKSATPPTPQSLQQDFTVALQDPNSDRPSFQLPAWWRAVWGDNVALVFELTVTDARGATATDEVTVNMCWNCVSPPDSSPPPEGQAAVAPTANAGPDLSGAPGDSVTLQGTNSANPYGEWWEMAHQWTQLSGPTVTLTHPETSQPAANFGDPRLTIPADAAGGTTLEFQLTVTDQEGESDSDTMTVTVTGDVPDTNGPPAFDAGPDAAFSLPENTAAGGNVGLPVTAQDPDNDVLAYSLSGTDAASFDIDAASGQLTTKEGVSYDYETQASYALTVEASDGNGGSATIDVTVSLTDVEETPPESREESVNNAPVFDEGTGAERSMAENTAAGVNVGLPVTATDPDEDTLAYSLSGDDAGSFDLNAATGQLTTKEGVSYDYETQASYALTVEASDGNGGSATIDVTVSLTDVEEALPVTACFTDLNELTATAEFSGRWDDADCRAHHQDSLARYIQFTLSEETEVSITLTSESGGALFVSKGTPQNGWGTPPKATYEHRVNVRRNNGKLVHDGAHTGLNSVTLTLAPGETYTVEAAGSGGSFTLSIEPQ